MTQTYLAEAWHTALPLSEVAGGASLLRLVHEHDARLCARCTAVRFRALNRSA